MDLDRLADVSRTLALQAGEAIMQVYQAADMGTTAKADASPVTMADLRADAIISAGLRAAFPDVALVTEEQAATHGQHLSTFLIVDLHEQLAAGDTITQTQSAVVLESLISQFLFNKAADAGSSAAPPAPSPAGSGVKK